MRELRNNGGDVLERVQAGEHFIVTKSGRAVAEIRPLAHRTLDRNALLARWRHLPSVDPVAFRRDIDEVLDTSI
ncbi:MAG: type II toxin-antitoxin system prevent-host-death family antitoxin [Rhodococcus sp.]|nr:type II toxin-antitoxin system prevent-host-death family antitoxin [Rhodococcus sp. (in: high G+C Gram-positive bacteria)]